MTTPREALREAVIQHNVSVVTHGPVDDAWAARLLGPDSELVNVAEVLRRFDAGEPIKDLMKAP